MSQDNLQNTGKNLGKRRKELVDRAVTELALMRKMRQNGSYEKVKNRDYTARKTRSGKEGNVKS